MIIDIHTFQQHHSTCQLYMLSVLLQEKHMTLFKLKQKRSQNNYHVYHWWRCSVIKAICTVLYIIVIRNIFLSIDIINPKQYNWFFFLTLSLQIKSLINYGEEWGSIATRAKINMKRTIPRLCEIIDFGC